MSYCLIFLIRGLNIVMCLSILLGKAAKKLIFSGPATKSVGGRVDKGLPLRK